MRIVIDETLSNINRLANIQLTHLFVKDCIYIKHLFLPLYLRQLAES